MTDTPILETQQVRKHYRVGRRVVRAVDGIDMRILPARSVGIAGESGSGKSALLRLLLALEGPTDGDVLFHGRSLADLTRSQMREYRAAVQAVFQDPGSSFNPRKRIWHTITEPVWSLDGLSRRQQRTLAAELLESVELPRAYATRFPHELSGGERQRIAVARALASTPEVVLLDEPVTSLDVSIRGHVLNLLRERAHDLGVTYVVVSHDLTATYHLTDYLYIMYQGVVVEKGPTVEVIDAPLHPYTRLLVSSIGDPLYQPEREADADPRSGACAYLPRCEHAMDTCREFPPLFEPAPAREVRCYLHDGEEHTADLEVEIPTT